MASSKLLQEVILNTERKNKTVRINTCAGFLNVSKISQTDQKSGLPKNKADGFYFEILREQFREIKFYLQQARKNQNAESCGEEHTKHKTRLKLALTAMENTIKRLEEDQLYDFFESMKADKNSWLFIISSLSKGIHCHSDFFKRLLAENSKGLDVPEASSINGLKETDN
ncbi:hypothetical protein KJ966_08845 [bacterium]|nr:hypothetical protein [bacterium]